MRHCCMLVQSPTKAYSGQRYPATRNNGPGKLYSLIIRVYCYTFVRLASIVVRRVSSLIPGILRQKSPALPSRQHYFQACAGPISHPSQTIMASTYYATSTYQFLFLVSVIAFRLCLKATLVALQWRRLLQPTCVKLAPVGMYPQSLLGPIRRTG